MAPMTTESPAELVEALPAAAREIEDFAHTGGWDQPTQVFALVATRDLLAAEPGLADQVDPDAPLTPIAQESLPSGDLAEALAQLEWPDQVTGCALVQEIVVLPPEAEAGLPDDPEAARTAAAEHPDRREARLVAAVLRGGGEACAMRLRATGDGEDDLVQGAEIAPNLLHALHATFD
ncbi:PPA1309 family protein [Saccharopolyspora cebuensis]